MVSIALASFNSASHSVCLQFSDHTPHCEVPLARVTSTHNSLIFCGGALISPMPALFFSQHATHYIESDMCDKHAMDDKHASV